MKKLIILFLIFSSTSVFANQMAKLFPGPDGVRFSEADILKVEKRLRAKLEDPQFTDEENAEAANLLKILAVGKRAVQWFEKVNSTRPADQKMDLDQKGAAKGTSINAPSTTNAQILIDRYNKLMKETTPLITTVVDSTTELPTTAPLSDEEFVKTIRLFDVLYQHTVRWSGSQQYMKWYIKRSQWDVRGYLFLKNTPDLENKLNNWKSLTSEEKTNFRFWIQGLCHNSGADESDCESQIDEALSKNQASSIYLQFNKFGEAMYKSFFKVEETRSEIYWNEEKTKLYSPFLTPERTDIKDWLSTNIQDEWKGIGFNLLLDFKATSEKIIPHIEFQSGVTAHVNDIAGDTITMDGDYSISNYAQRWTIRHEYGHVLGFPDCYLEFFDVNQKAMIYYEIDIDNLMCSRHGNLKAEHITELRNAYK